MIVKRLRSYTTEVLLIPTWLEEPGWDRRYPHCVFPFEFVAWTTQKSKAKRQRCLHAQVMHSRGLTGNPMVSSTTSQLLSGHSLPTWGALAASPSPHSCHTVTNLPWCSPRGAPRCFPGFSSACSHVGARAPASTQSIKCFQAGEAPAAAWRHSHWGMGASVSLLPAQAHHTCPRGDVTAFSYPIKNVFEGI